MDFMKCRNSYKKSDKFPKVTQLRKNAKDFEIYIECLKNYMKKSKKSALERSIPYIGVK